VVIRLRIGGDKLPIKPNLFRVIDVDGDHALSEGELRDRESKRSRNPLRHLLPRALLEVARGLTARLPLADFEHIGKQMPPGIMGAEDTDKDGKIQWEEAADRETPNPGRESRDRSVHPARPVALPTRHVRHGSSVVRRGTPKTSCEPPGAWIWVSP
jgi:hypothetical protein